MNYPSDPPTMQSTHLDSIAAFIAGPLSVAVGTVDPELLDSLGLEYTHSLDACDLASLMFATHETIGPRHGHIHAACKHTMRAISAATAERYVESAELLALAKSYTPKLSQQRCDKS